MGKLDIKLELNPITKQEFETLVKCIELLKYRLFFDNQLVYVEENKYYKLVQRYRLFSKEESRFLRDRYNIEDDEYFIDNIQKALFEETEASRINLLSVKDIPITVGIPVKNYLEEYPDATVEEMYNYFYVNNKRVCANLSKLPSDFMYKDITSITTDNIDKHKKVLKIADKEYNINLGWVALDTFDSNFKPTWYKLSDAFDEAILLFNKHGRLNKANAITKVRDTIIQNIGEETFNKQTLSCVKPYYKKSQGYNLQHIRDAVISRVKEVNKKRDLNLPLELDKSLIIVNNHTYGVDLGVDRDPFKDTPLTAGDAYFELHRYIRTKYRLYAEFASQIKPIKGYIKFGSTIDSMEVVDLEVLKEQQGKSQHTSW